MLTKIKMQTIEHRPNTSVVFWENPSEYSEHIQSTYIDINVLDRERNIKIKNQK